MAAEAHAVPRAAAGREDNVVGSRLWPTYTAKSIGLFAIIAGVLALLGGLAQINPVWLYGPFDPSAVSTAAQPDWYLGWIEGALRLARPSPAHRSVTTSRSSSGPRSLLPGITFVLLYLWPFLERRFTHDTDEHHLLDRPSDRPMRTAIGVGVLTFFGCCCSRAPRTSGRRSSTCRSSPSPTPCGSCSSCSRSRSGSSPGSGHTTSLSTNPRARYAEGGEPPVGPVEEPRPPEELAAPDERGEVVPAPVPTLPRRVAAAAARAQPTGALGAVLVAPRAGARHRGRRSR